MHKFLTALILSLTAATAQAQQLTDAELKLGMALKTISLNSPQNQLLNPRSAQMQNPVTRQVLQNLDFQQINMDAAHIMASQFTMEELQTLIDFQTSPIGLSIHRKMSIFQHAVGGLVEEAMQQKFKDMTAAGTLQGISNQPTTPALPGFQGGLR
ncbi:MAG: hypothetical protein OXR68_02185 [Alphaproteobacteria bacterium]|nr:hypothetical protein [Alphaproteobacteria bacterium]MDD9919420.1 hypothetical protein [Alphaproteobacteria bacterium]